MTIYILSKYKIQALEDNSSGDFCIDDLISSVREHHTKIIDNELLANNIFARNPNLHYKYSVKINKDVAKFKSK